mmetsp:Transcript_127447/g.224450  ORF Transcript_127447/g.224450 Transcript_127447/m.224450 type:complete len:560 (-) Transcript_127447:248-1927(-)
MPQTSTKQKQKVAKHLKETKYQPSCSNTRVAVKWPLKIVTSCCAGASLVGASWSLWHFFHGAGTDPASCRGRALQIAAVFSALRRAGLKCHLEIGIGFEECNLDVHVQGHIATNEEVCFVPESLYLQPYVAASWEAQDAHVLASHLRTLYSEHSVCDSRAALAVRLMREGRHRCDCSRFRDLRDFGESCSIWPCLIPKRFISVLEFSARSQQLLEGTSARWSMEGLRSQLENVNRCVEKVAFFPASDALTDQEVAWGFHAMRTRGSGRDSDNSRVNPVTVMLNHHIDSTLGHVFVETDARKDAKGNLEWMRGEVMRAKFDLEPGHGIFYNYGEFTNSELLVLYGFVVPASSAQEAHVPAVRLFVKDLALNDVQPVDDNEVQKWRLELQGHWRDLRCGEYLAVAFGYHGGLILEKSRMFPACAAFHYLWASPMSFERRQVLEKQNVRRIMEWPLRLQEGDARIWHALAAHQWKLLHKICGDELHRLLGVAKQTGLQHDEYKGAFQWNNTGPWHDDKGIAQAILQIVNDEVKVWKRCEHEALLASTSSLQGEDMTMLKEEL